MEKQIVFVCIGIPVPCTLTTEQPQLIRYSDTERLSVCLAGRTRSTDMGVALP